MVTAVSSCAACGSAARSTCKACSLVLVSLLLPRHTLGIQSNIIHSTVALSAKRLIGLNTKYIASLSSANHHGGRSGFYKTARQHSWVAQFCTLSVPRVPGRSIYGAMFLRMMCCSYRQTRAQTTKKTSRFCSRVRHSGLLARVYPVKSYANMPTQLLETSEMSSKLSHVCRRALLNASRCPSTTSTSTLLRGISSYFL
jgi:hypothetical protein